VRYLVRTRDPWHAKLNDPDPAPFGRRAAVRDVCQVDVDVLHRRPLASIKVVASRYETGRTTLRVTLYPRSGAKEVELDEMDGGKGRSQVDAVDVYLRMVDRPAQLDELERILVEALEAREALGRFETLAKMGGV
jgi:hypothetical protein